MQQLEILVNEIKQIKMHIIMLLKQSVHSTHQALINTLNNTDATQWLDYAEQNLGAEYTFYIERMTQLEAAVSQIEIGLYGVCCDCEQTIEKKRLIDDVAEQRCTACSLKAGKSKSSKH
jgi:RNA polymerase-binding transcription factor DksA